MFIKLTALLLIPLMLSCSFSRVFIYAGFNINKKYIAASLCENRNKPQLHCNGKCFLMKKIKQADQKEKAEEQQFKKNNSQEAFIHKSVTPHLQFAKNIEIVFTNPTFNYPQKSNSVFEPPRA